MQVSIYIPDSLVSEIDEYSRNSRIPKDLKFSKAFADSAVEELKAQTNQRSFDFIKTGIVIGLKTRAKPVPQKANRTTAINALIQFALNEIKSDKEYTLEQLLEMIEAVPRPAKLK